MFCLLVCLSRKCDALEATLADLRASAHIAASSLDPKEEKSNTINHRMVKFSFVR